MRVMVVVVALISTASAAWAQEALPPAQAASEPAPSPEAESARAIAEAIHQSLDLPGLGVAVAVDGKIVVAEYLGWSDQEKQQPLAAASLFRVGSVSKLLTATAMARLKQAGRLDIDAPISRYLDDVPEDKAAITPRQIAGHLGGFAHYGDSDYLNTTHYASVSESLTRYLGIPLVAPPGTKYAYSSYGFNVLGAVLQAAGGKDFRDAVAAEVTGPLGLSRTSAEDSSDPPAHRVHLYSRTEEGALVEAPVADLTDRWPSGGFLSTAEDLARLGAGVLEPDFLGPEAREELFTRQRTADGKEAKAGLGWRVAVDDAGRRFVHHGGDTSGGRAFLLVYPDERIAVALTTNLTFAPLGEKEGLRLAAPFLKP
jgi:CubicO group peptidase (beta-lactamase class C family)